MATVRRSRSGPPRDRWGLTGALPAALAAGALSGLPSTVHTLATGRSPRAAVEAAGALVGRPTVPAGALVHAGLSLGWAAVLARVLPRRATVAAGATAGLLIAALDLGVVGRRIPAVRALPVGPQVADHVAFGAVAAAVIAGARGRQAGRHGSRRPRTPRAVGNHEHGALLTTQLKSRLLLNCNQ